MTQKMTNANILFSHGYQHLNSGNFLSALKCFTQSELVYTEYTRTSRYICKGFAAWCLYREYPHEADMAVDMMNDSVNGMFENHYTGGYLGQIEAYKLLIEMKR